MCQHHNSIWKLGIYKCLCLFMPIRMFLQKWFHLNALFSRMRVGNIEKFDTYIYVSDLPIHYYSSSISMYVHTYINISSVMEFQRWWVLKSKLFGQESTCHQGKIFKKFLQVMTVRQKAPKSYFQSQFWMSKNNRIFSKKKFI